MSVCPEWRHVGYMCALRDKRGLSFSELEAIVDKLPKTKDRVPVVIHVDKVWFLHDGEPMCQVVPPDCVTLSRTVAECYSSEEALRAAIAEAEGKGVGS